MEFALSLIKIIFALIMVGLLWIPISIIILSLSVLNKKVIYQKIVFNSERILYWSIRIVIISWICESTGVYETWAFKAITILVLNTFLVSQQFGIEYHNRTRSSNSKINPFVQSHVLEVESNKFLISILGILAILITIIFSLSWKLDFISGPVHYYLDLFKHSWIKISISIITIIAFVNTLFTSMRYQNIKSAD